MTTNTTTNTITVTVHIADSDSARRSKLSAAVEAHDGLVLTGSSDTETAFQAVDEVVPRVVLLGSGSSGAQDLVNHLHEHLPAVSVAVVDPTDDFELLAAGARSTLSSNASDIALDVQRMLDDEAVLPPDWAVELGVRLDGLDERVRHTLQISETEREIMARRGNGDDIAAIASDNDVTERLVRQHLGFAVAKYQLALEAQAALADHASTTD